MFYFTSGVYAAAVDGLVVFADLNRNRYVCMPQTSSKGAFGSKAEPNFVNSPHVISSLRKSQLISDQGDSGRAFMIVEASKQLNDQEDTRPLGVQKPFSLLGAALSVLIPFAIARVLAQVALWSGRWYRHSSSLLYCRTAISQPDIASLVTRFRTLGLLTFPKDACLLKALTLKYFLRWYGAESKLVLGVRTEPFYAHAWTECDGLVLTDMPDVISFFVRVAEL